MHILSGGDSKHLEKDRNQICFKREGTLALNLLVHVLVQIVDVVDLDHGLVPHIDSGSYREEANTGKEEHHSTWHRFNAHTRMMNDMLKVTEIRILSADINLSRSEGVNPNFPDSYARV